jgi:hypothetical protein
MELFSRGTEFRRGFLSMLSIEGAIDKGLKKFVNKQEEIVGTSSVVQTSSDSSLSVPLGDLDHLKIL